MKTNTKWTKEKNIKTNKKFKKKINKKGNYKKPYASCHPW